MTKSKGKLYVINNEILTALCWACSCCLPRGSHCWVCHSTLPMVNLCGCGNCEEKIIDYLERTQAADKKNRLDRLAKSAEKVEA